MCHSPWTGQTLPSFLQNSQQNENWRTFEWKICSRQELLWEMHPLSTASWVALSLRLQPYSFDISRSNTANERAICQEIPSCRSSNHESWAWPSNVLPSLRNCDLFWDFFRDDASNQKSTGWFTDNHTLVFGQHDRDRTSCNWWKICLMGLSDSDAFQLRGLPGV